MPIDIVTEYGHIKCDGRRERDYKLLVSIREFKAHLSRYLAEVRAGDPVEITSHRKVVAQVTAVPSEDDTGIARLIALGVAEWQGGKPVGAELRLCDGGRRVSEIVLEDRH